MGPKRVDPMTVVSERIAGTFGISRRLARWLMLAAVVGIILFVAGATVTRGVVPALGAAAVFLIVLASFRWPLLPLFAFALLTPIEELLVLGPLGTLSRYAGILFVLAYGLPRLGRLRISAMPVPGWIYVGWAILSVIWALDGNATLAELSVLLLLFAVAVMIAAQVSERPSIVPALLWAYSLSAAVTAVVGIYLYVAGAANADRVAALPGQDPAYYAALLLPALAFSLDRILKGRELFLSVPVAIVTLTGIVVSGTRGAWVAVIVLVVFFVLPRMSRARSAIATVAILGFLLVSVQLPGVSTLVTDRAQTAVSSGGAGRTDIWAVGLTIYWTAPVVGVGLANFPVAYTPEIVRQTDVGVYSANNGANRAPHSMLIGTLGELGIIGLIILASFLLPLMLRRGWGPDAIAIQSALVSLVVAGLFLDVLSRKQVWLMIGIACGLAFVARAQTKPAALGPTRPQSSGVATHLAGDAQPA